MTLRAWGRWILSDIHEYSDLWIESSVCLDGFSFSEVNIESELWIESRVSLDVIVEPTKVVGNYTYIWEQSSENDTIEFLVDYLVMQVQIHPGVDDVVY